MAPSTPQGLLAGSKREHLFYLLGIHTQQSLTILTLYHLANLVPFTGNTSTSPLLWRASSYPQFTFQFPTGHTQSYTSSNTESKHKSSNTPELKIHTRPQSSFMAGIYRQWSCLQLCQLYQSASSSVLTLFWDFSLSHTPHYTEHLYSHLVENLYAHKTKTLDTIPVK